MNALRWYDAADEADPALRARTVSGRCRALLRSGRQGEAQALAARLQDKDPGSLALSEIHRALRDYGDDEGMRRPAPTGTMADQVPAPPPDVATGGDNPDNVGADNTTTDNTTTDKTEAAAARYTLQLGAFGDRSRALELERRVAGKVEGLTMAEGVDARGQAVYRLRTGAFGDESAADDAARDLGQLLGIDVIVVDLQAAEHQGE